MSRAKAFWLALAGTLALVLPVYLATAAILFTRGTPVDTPQSGVPIAQPTTGDARLFLLMTGPEQPETFVLLRFDAADGLVCTLAMPAETVVLANGKPITLAEAVQQAGPAQAAAALEETLPLSVDHYLYCTAAQLAEMTDPMGTARIPLSNYLTPEALRRLQLQLPGIDTLSLTPQMLADVLAAGAAAPDLQTLLRAEGYLAFLRVGGEALAREIPDALRRALAQTSTDLTAVDIYDYERIFGFLLRETPQYRAAVLPGSWENGRYELSPEAAEVAAAYLGA